MKYSVPGISFLWIHLFVAMAVMNRCQAFGIPNAVTTFHRYQTSTTLPTLWSTSGDDNDTSTKPVKQVLCPDCDLCDGSGRYVY